MSFTAFFGIIGALWYTCTTPELMLLLKGTPRLDQICEPLHCNVAEVHLSGLQVSCPRTKGGTRETDMTLT